MTVKPPDPDVDLTAQPAERTIDAPEGLGSSSVARPERRAPRRRTPVRAKVTSTKYGCRSFSSPLGHDPEFRAGLAQALGTVSPDFLEASLHQLTKAVAHCDAPEGGAEMELNAALALVQAIKPTNELEAALSLQIAATHQLGMEMMARVRRGATTTSTTVYGGLAAKLLRAFAAQVEVLERLRRGGQQTVTVKHVTVAARAKAIIGSVTNNAENPGVNKNSRQAHAPEI
jgi:hypothetical protein